MEFIWATLVWVLIIVEVSGAGGSHPDMHWSVEMEECAERVAHSRRKLEISSWSLSCSQVPASRDSLCGPFPCFGMCPSEFIQRLDTDSNIIIRSMILREEHRRVICPVPYETRIPFKEPIASALSDDQEDGLAHLVPTCCRTMAII